MSSSKFTYCVVEFPEEKTTALVSSSWLTENDKYCYWPSGVNVNPTTCAQRHAQPNSKWIRYRCRVLEHYAQYNLAVKGLKKSEVTSNLESSSQDSSVDQSSRRTKRKPKHPPAGGLPFLELSTASRRPEIPSSPSSPSSVDSESSPSSPLLKVTNSTPGLLDSVRDIRETLPAQQTTTSGSNQCSSPLEEIKRRLDKIESEHRRSQEVLVGYLIKIAADQKELLRRTAESEQQETLNAASHNLSLPISSLEDFRHLVDWLDVPQNFQSYVNDLSVIGGSSITSITQRILNTLISNSVAKELSLTGKGKKTKAGLSGTSFLTLIYDTIRVTKGGRSATNKEIDVAIQRWLKGATDREGGRLARLKCRQQESPLEPAAPSGQSGDNT